MDKLLLIDDEADVQYSFRRIFDSPEIELTTATSGEEGLRVIPRLKPNLVIMDVRMGGMNTSLPPLPSANTLPAGSTVCSVLPSEPGTSFQSELPGSRR